MKRTIAAILSFATALSLCACGGGSAATDSNAAADNSTAASGDTMVLRLANSHNAEHITSQACQRFADSVKEKTDGRITIECHFAGELGDERSLSSSASSAVWISPVYPPVHPLSSHLS